jgi:hypothetical protein
MKFLYKWLYRKMQNAQDDCVVKDLDYPKSRVSAGRSLSSSDFNSQPTRFNIYRADGGHVVEVSRYCRSSDETKNSMYLITHDQNFGERIEHILTLEAIKN